MTGPQLALIGWISRRLTVTEALVHDGQSQGRHVYIMD